jgi:2-polyprenyl-6-methoxyphenol hydroxylase-like FAD-dependent oxidoreductase
MITTLSNCAVLGAGIGGLTLALSLQRLGVNVSVYERTLVISEIGAGLLLTPNAVSILDALGLKELLRPISVETPRWQVLDVAGSVLAQIQPMTQNYPAISVRRADLQQLLVSQLGGGSIHLGHEAKRITSGVGEATVEFANGERSTAQLVAVADGIHSQIRDGFFRQTAKRPCHYVGWRAMVDFVPKGWETGTVTETWGRGMRFGLAATGENRCYWYASANRGPHQQTTQAERKALLMDLFSGWHRPVMELLEATTQDQSLENEIAERPVLRKWHQDGVVLLGDAAHAMTPNLGQGAAMAIEDAWELAQSFAQAKDVPEGLNVYEGRRRRRVQAIQWASRFVGLAIQLESPVLCSLRDNFVRYSPNAAAQASLQWIFKPRF